MNDRVMVPAGLNAEACSRIRASRKHLMLAAACLLVTLAACPDLVFAQCSISATGLAYGDYVSFHRSHRDSRATISVSCTGAPMSSLSYSIKLSGGLEDTFHPRRMRFKSFHMDYNLFRNSARSEVWGDGTASTELVTAEFTIPASGGPVRRDHSVFGRLFAGQNIPPGQYSDLVQATLEVCDSGGRCELASVALRVE